MSALRRIASGSSASMIGLLVNVVGQIALVPLFLSHWDRVTFGVWAAVQGFLSIMQLVDYGHQDFVGFECLRKPVEDRAWRSLVLSSALPFSLLSGATPLLLVGGLWFTGSFGLLFDGGGAELVRTAAIASVIYAVTWLLAQSLSGLLGRVISSVGEAPRQQWNNVFQAAIASLAQALAVSMGAGIVGTVACQAVVTVIYHGTVSFRYVGLLRRKSVVLGRPDFRLGARNLWHSLALTAGATIETLQLAGFRVVLIPLIGPAAVAQFATLRTVANTAQQGTNTFVYPAVPELMRVAAARNAASTMAILGLLWLLAVMLIAPGIVLLQFVAPLIYHSWTRGKIPWDGMTFALLSAAIVVNGLGQPARAILRGNNLLRQQVLNSVAAATVLLGGTWFIVPHLGLLGAAIALMAGEAARCVLTIFWADHWLRSVSLQTPARTMAITALIAVGCGITVCMMAYWPEHQLGLAGAFLIGWGLCLVLFWRALPPEIHARLRPLLHRLGPRRRLASPVAAGMGGDMPLETAGMTETIRAPA